MLDGDKSENQRRRRAVRLCIRIFAWIAALVLILEFSLRTILGLGSPVLFVTDDNFGYFPKSAQHLHRFFAEIDTNQYGMRSPAISDVKKKGEYRILFVGDSVPYGTTYVSQEDIFVQLIGTYLRNNKKMPISVLNASSPGWAPSNELGFIRTRGRYGADMVVLVYNTKDLTQSFTPYVASPLVPLQNPTTAVGELWSRYLKPRLFAQSAAVDPGSTTIEGRPSATAEARVMETIEATRQLVVSEGARFVILFSPVVQPDVLRYQADWDQALYNLKKWAAQHGVPIVDMTQIMRAHDAKSLYFDGVHLRPAGNRIVADAFVYWFDTDLREQVRQPHQ